VCRRPDLRGLPYTDKGRLAYRVLALCPRCFAAEEV
jgi:hypothetical protein